MFKKLFALGLLIVGSVVLTACGPKEVEPTDAELLEMVDAAMTELSLPATTSQDLVLPSTGLNDVEITWASNRDQYITDAGVVTIPTKTEGDQIVTMTATLTKGGQTLSTTFSVTVVAATEYTTTELLEDAKGALSLPSGIVESDLDLPTTGANETTVAWASDTPTVIAADGTVTRPEPGSSNATVVLTATLTLNDESVTRDYEVIVAAMPEADVYNVVATLHDQAALTDDVVFQGVVSGVYSAGYYVSDGVDAINVYKPDGDYTFGIGDTVKITGKYGTYKTMFQITDVTAQELITEGDGTNPMTPVVKTIEEIVAYTTASEQTVADKLLHGQIVTITGTVLQHDNVDGHSSTWLSDGTNELMVYYKTNSESMDALNAKLGLEITINAMFYAYDSKDVEWYIVFDGTADDIVMDALSDADALAADVTALNAGFPAATIDSVTLPTEGENGTVFSNWASDNAAVLDNTGAIGTLTETTVVTFTATATKGEETEEVTLMVTVPVTSTIGEVNAMDKGDYFHVEGVVYNESKYGFYIWANAEYIFVFTTDQQDNVEYGDQVSIVGKLGSYNGLTQVNIVSYTVGTTGNALPTAVAGSVESILSRVTPAGQPTTITAVVSREGEHNNVYLAGLTGEKVNVYYNTDDEAFHNLVGQTVTATVIPYQDGQVLFEGVEADITVESAYAPTDAMKAQAAADLINLGDLMEVAVDLVLPTEETDTGATIAWSTTDAAVVTDAGVITIAYGSNATATLTATVTVGTEVVTRDFVVSLVDGDTLEAISVADALALTDDTTVLVEGVVTGMDYKNRPTIQDANGNGIYVYQSYIGDDFAVGDKVVIRGTLGTYSNNYGNVDQRQLNDASLIEVVSSNNDIVLSATDVTPADLAQNYTTAYSEVYVMTLKYLGNVTNSGNEFFTFEGYVDADPANNIEFKMSVDYVDYFEYLYAVNDTIEIKFVVYNFHYDRVQIIPIVMPTLTDVDNLDIVEAMLMENDGATITADLDLATEYADYGVTVSWASSDDALVDPATGVVTRPANGAGDAAVTLTATLTAGTETRDVLVTGTVLEEAAPWVAVGTELFISEYAEHGNEKVIEIFNPTGAAIDLSTYTLKLSTNANTTFGSAITLTGTIEAGDVFIIANSQAAEADILAALDQTSGSLTFNGNDAVGLFKDDVLIDVIGVVGDESYFGADTVFIRNADIVGPNATYTVGEWTEMLDKDYTDLGQHTATPTT